MTGMRVRFIKRWDAVKTTPGYRWNIYWVEGFGFLTVFDPLMRLFGAGKWLR